MIECPCRFCKKRSSNCHSKCIDYIDWSEENAKMNAKVRENKMILYLSRSDRPKRRHGRK